MRAALLLLVLLAGCPERQPAIEPVKVGVLNPISGALASLGPSWEDAARLAAEEVNAGGGIFDGRPLELLFEDDATDAAAAVTAAQGLVGQGVVGLIGPATSGESTEVLAQVAAPNELPMISCCATAADLTAGNQPNAGFFFRTTPSDKLQGKALAFLAKNGFANIAIAKPCSHVAFIFRNDAYGSGFHDVFTGEYEGADIVGTVQNGHVIATGSYGSPDAEANQAELVAAGQALVADIDASPDIVAGPNPELCVVMISFDVDGAPVARQIDQSLTDMIATRVTAEPTFTLGYHFLTGDGANSSAFADPTEGGVGALGAKILGTVPFHAENTAYDEFVKAYKARFDLADEPIAFTAQNYDAVFVMALAITKAKSTVGKDIRNKLYPVSGSNGGDRFEGAFFGEVANAILAGGDVDYVGPSGEVTFDAFGDVVGDYVLWQVADDGTGAFTVVNRDPLPASTFNP